MVGILFLTQLQQEIGDEFGGARFGGESRGTNTEEEAERRHGVAQPEILGISVRFLDSVLRILSEARIHPLRTDENLGAGGPVRHDDVDLLPVVLSQDERLGRSHAGGRGSQDALQKSLAFGYGERMQQAGHGSGKHAWCFGSRPCGVGIEAGPAKFV